MFERFTEKARRVVFFARYEASQYGSSHIDTEHLLLGLCREDHAVRAYLKDTEMDSAVRAEVERQIVRGKPFGTSVEVPLSADGKNALRFAAEEADRLGQRQIGTEHLLLGILRVKNSLGAQVAAARGLTADDFREYVAKSPRWRLAHVAAHPRKLPGARLDEFLAGLKSQSADCLMLFFAERAQVVDVHGKRWTYDELAENFDAVFAPYAKKNATYVIEQTVVDGNDCFVAAALWKNALVASMERVWMHRMTVALIPENEDWQIVSLQVTPVQP